MTLLIINTQTNTALIDTSIFHLFSLSSTRLPCRALFIFTAFFPWVNFPIRSASAPDVSVCFTAFPAPGITTMLLSCGTISFPLGAFQVRAFVRCTWVQEGLNTTELHKAKYCFSWTAKKIPPWCCADLVQEKEKWCHNWRKTVDDTELHKQKRWFCQFVPVSDKCLTYLWFPEQPSMWTTLTNDGMYDALLSPLTVFPTICWMQQFAADWQEGHSQHSFVRNLQS